MPGSWEFFLPGATAADIARIRKLGKKYLARVERRIREKEIRTLEGEEDFRRMMHEEELRRLELEWRPIKGRELLKKDPPGKVLQRMAEIFYDEQRREEIFFPLIEDARDEFATALKIGDVWRARWVGARLYWDFTVAIGRSGGFKVLRVGVRIIKWTTGASVVRAAWRFIFE